MSEFKPTKISEIHWSNYEPFGDLALWAIPPLRGLCFALDTAIEEEDTNTAAVLVNDIVARLEDLEKALTRLNKEHVKSKSKELAKIRDEQNPFPELNYCDQEKIMVFLENIEHQLGAIGEPFKKLVKALEVKKAADTETSHKDSTAA